MYPISERRLPGSSADSDSCAPGKWRSIARCAEVAGGIDRAHQIEENAKSTGCVEIIVHGGREFRAGRLHLGSQDPDRLFILIQRIDGLVWSLGLDFRFFTAFVGMWRTDRQRRPEEH